MLHSRYFQLKCSFGKITFFTFHYLLISKPQYTNTATETCNAGFVCAHWSLAQFPLNYTECVLIFKNNSVLSWCWALLFGFMKSSKWHNHNDRLATSRIAKMYKLSECKKRHPKFSSTHSLSLSFPALSLKIRVNLLIHWKIFIFWTFKIVLNVSSDLININWTQPSQTPTTPDWLDHAFINMRFADT